MLKALALALFLLLVAAAPSQAWTNPLLMSFSDEEADGHAVGIDGAGNAVVVLQEDSGGIFVNTRGADESFGLPRRINEGHGQQPKIATNAAGLSVIAWIATDGPDARVHMRLRRADGTFTTDTTISPAGADATAPEVGIDTAGDAFVTWQANDGTTTRTYLRVKSGRTGSLGSVLPVSPATGTNIEPHLAVEPGGRAFMTWTTGGQISGRARSTSGGLSGPVPLADTGASGVDEESLSLDGSGRALVAWISTSDFRVRARTRAADGHLSAIATLSDAGKTAESIGTAAATTTGTGVVGWTQVGSRRVLVSRRLVGTDWKAPTNVTPPDVGAGNLVMGTSADAARTIFVFTTFEDGGSTERIRAREERADGHLGPLSIVSAENGNGGGTPRLAVNAAGDAAATWFSRLTPTGFDLIWVGTNFLR